MNLEKIEVEKTNKNSFMSTPLSRIGSLIKEARLKRNESITDLAADLKISAQQFKAIEEGQEDQLPERVFVKAMIKRISERLKLDSDFIMSEFNNLKNENNIEGIIEEVKKEKTINKEQNKETPYIFIIAVIISGLIGLFASSIFLSIFSNSENNSNSMKKEIIK